LQRSPGLDKRRRLTEVAAVVVVAAAFGPRLTPALVV
jgi:hypothetical protein